VEGVLSNEQRHGTVDEYLQNWTLKHSKNGVGSLPPQQQGS